MARAALVALSILAVASAAPAGGVPVAAASAGHTLWTVSDLGLRKLDTRTLRSTPGPDLPHPYAVQVATGGGAVWVASVENGYGSGAVSRIDLASGRVSTPLSLPHRGVFGLAVGGGYAWALLGPWSKATVARIPLSGRGRARFVRVPGFVGWIAADRFGLWLWGGGRLLRIDPASARMSTVARVPGSYQLALGLGSVWLAAWDTLVRIDERSGRVLAKIAVGPSANAPVVAQGSVWLLRRVSETCRLVRVDPGMNRVAAQRRLAGSATSVTYADGRLWVGEVQPSPRLLAVNPATLAVERAIPLL
jgi:hypothetical protein